MLISQTILLSQLLSHFGPGIARIIKANRLSKGQKTRLVRKKVVVAARASRSSLVEELQIASIDCLCLVGVCTDQIAAADVVGPGSATVSLASERFGLG